jgi:hypothetical protein
MEPLDEKELNHLLQTWEAPAAPQSLEDRVLSARRPKWRWWKWLVTGSIRIPVPVGVAVVGLLALWFYFARQPVPVVPQAKGTVSLADFRPVEQLEPVILGGPQ